MISKSYVQIESTRLDSFAEQLHGELVIMDYII